jgi:hypothetical protein
MQKNKFLEIAVFSLLVLISICCVIQNRRYPESRYKTNCLQNGFWQDNR